VTRIVAWCLAALWFAAAPAGAQAWEAGTDGMMPIPALKARVTDLTQTLSAAETQALTAKLADWEARTGNQLAVLMVPTTQPEPIEAYSIRVADAWKLGRKGNDNGVLFLVAKNDRKMRIEVGYGLEGTLTDVTSRRIIAENVSPQFREGKFGAGIDAGIDRIINVVAEGKPLPPPQAKPAAKTGGNFDFGTLLVILFIAVPIVGGVLRGIFGRLPGSAVGAGIFATAAWFVAGSILIAVAAAVVAFIVMLFTGGGTGGPTGRGGPFIPSGGWGGGGGGGGFSGGGGASGNW
jgi:uncharacterized protein